MINLQTILFLLDNSSKVTFLHHKIILSNRSKVSIFNSELNSLGFVFIKIQNIYYYLMMELFYLLNFLIENFMKKIPQ